MEWHAMPIEDVFRKLNTPKNGLTSEEAEKRLAIYGKNIIESEKKINPLKIFLKQFTDFLVLILIAAAIISFAMSLIPGEEGHSIDAILIVAILFANATIGFFQEYKAEKSILALKKLSAPTAMVLRDGIEKEIPAELLVPGDIVFLEAGSKVPADARIIEQASLQIDESMLTGESVPVSKNEAPISSHAPLAERSNMLYMNTLVTRGRAKALVVATGKNTEVGKIAELIAKIEEKETPFQAELNRLGKVIGIAILFIIAFVAFIQLLIVKDSLFEIFLRAVSLAVAAVPEGLPAVVSIALTFGVNRMARRKALARRLSVAESLGSVNVICTDKTGTLTENTMTVRQIFFNMQLCTVTGQGYDAKGEFFIADKIIDGAELKPLLECGVLCNDARQYLEGGQIRYAGDPTEIALLLSAKKAGIDPDIEREKNPRIQEIPFSSERKLMTVVCMKNGKKKAYVKGAPEIVLERCTHILLEGRIVKFSDELKQKILAENSEMAKKALRVLAFAFKEDVENEGQLEQNLIFLGLQGMIDPPRANVKEALEDCRKAGIKVIMVTGDNIETAKAIGKELGFATEDAMDSNELSKINDFELLKKLDKVEIFARVSPLDKTRILDALHKKGLVVAMTGDGINDAPSLKKADVGIAMGIRGTDVAKEVSDLILLDDNFVTIRDAVEEGRAIFDNIRKFVNYLLSSNLAEVLAVFLFTLMQVYLYFGEGVAILTATQLLWINMLTDGLPAVALGVDPAAEGIMRRKPRAKNEGVINKRTASSIASIGLTMAIVILAAFLYSFFTSEGDVRDKFFRAQTIVFTCFVFFEMVRIQMVRARYRINLFSNRWLWIAISASLALQIMIIYTPLNAIFKIVPLSIDDWLVIAAALASFAFLSYILVKLENAIFGGE